jgi:hypothetical protein
VNTRPGVTIQKCDGCTVIEKCVGCSNVEKPDTQCKQSDSYDPRNDTLYRAYLIFTIAGVCVALLGIGAIYLQTRATREAAEATRDSAEATLRSAKASERSVKLQENTQRQWVNLEDWHVSRINPTDPLEVSFKIVNPTGLPLMLHAVITKVNGAQTEEEIPMGLLIPSNPLMHGVGVPLDREQESLYARVALALDIECTVLFADAHGIHWRQEFGQKMLCGPANTIVTDTKNTLQESGVPGERGSRGEELP